MIDGEVELTLTDKLGEDDSVDGAKTHRFLLLQTKPSQQLVLTLFDFDFTPHSFAN